METQSQRRAWRIAERFFNAKEFPGPMFDADWMCEQQTALARAIETELEIERDVRPPRLKRAEAVIEAAQNFSDEVSEDRTTCFSPRLAEAGTKLDKALRDWQDGVVPLDPKMKVLTIPLMRKIELANIDDKVVDVDIEYLGKLVALANKIGRHGKTIVMVHVEPSEDEQGCQFSFQLEDVVLSEG